jgi:phage shock protein A
MTTTELLLIQIQSLTELELDDFLQGIGQHLSKNNLEHLIDRAFDMEGNQDRIDELEDENELLESKVEELEKQIAELEKSITTLKKSA